MLGVICTGALHSISDDLMTMHDDYYVLVDHDDYCASESLCLSGFRYQ